jgi:hypothetical protein
LKQEATEVPRPQRRSTGRIPALQGRERVNRPEIGVQTSAPIETGRFLQTRIEPKIFVSGGHFDFYETTYHGGVCGAR